MSDELQAKIEQDLATFFEEYYDGHHHDAAHAIITRLGLTREEAERMARRNPDPKPDGDTVSSLIAAVWGMPLENDASKTGRAIADALARMGKKVVDE